MPYIVKVIADSVNDNGDRLTTIEAVYPRFIHSELLTHRVFSRSSSSSRAIPIKKLINAVKSDPVTPVEWGSNCAGMQSKELLTGDKLIEAHRAWMSAVGSAIYHAEWLADCGVHKQLANRVIEPFSWITTVISTTEWINFFKLRCHKDAQPEMRKLAEMILDVRNASTPVHSFCHLPYTTTDEKNTCSLDDLFKKSTARCARTSYLRQDEIPCFEKDCGLHDMLKEKEHWSPFEHVAVQSTTSEKIGNFTGWTQYRHLIGG